MAFIESYQQNLDRIQIVSKLSCFLIAIILLIEVGTNIYKFTFWGNLENVSENLFQFKLSHSFLIPITIIFGIRFALLWGKTSKFVWFSLINWLIGWLLILAYYLTTQRILFGSFFDQYDINCVDCIYSMLFLWASKSVAILLYSYLLFSPLKQISTLIFSYFYRK